MPDFASHLESELMDVLLSFHQHKNGCVSATFVDGSGTKVVMRLSPEAARNLRDELLDLEDQE